MKQPNLRLIAEINRLLGNTILKDGGVYLPDLGSLTVTTTPPSMDGVASSATDPVRRVVITNEERHRSILVTISERAACSPDQAALVYNKWQEMVRKNGRIVIEEVGEISDNIFTPTKDFHAKLNPITTKPKASTVVKKQSVQEANRRAKSEETGGKSKFFTLVMILIVGLIVAFTTFYIFYKPSENSAVKSVIVEEIVKTDTSAKSEQSTKKEQPEPAVEQEVESEPQEEMVRDGSFEARVAQGRKDPNLHYKVVYGAYSTPENATKAAQEADAVAQGAIYCTIYYHGKSYLVSLFDTASAEEATDFITKNRSKFHDSLWIHKR